MLILIVVINGNVIIFMFNNIYLLFVIIYNIKVENFNLVDIVKWYNMVVLDGLGVDVMVDIIYGGNGIVGMIYIIELMKYDVVIKVVLVGVVYEL